MSSKKYLYKVYRNAAYVGLLPTPNNDFAYSQDINTAGCEINIQIPASLDDAGATISSETLTDETGTDIVDEFGSPILTNVTYQYANIPIDLANRVDVWLYYDGAINGVRVFSGLIMSWGTNLKAQTIDLRVASYGIKLNDYLVSVPNNSAVESFDDTSSYETLYSEGSAGVTKIGQSFTVPTAISASSIEILLYASYPTQVNIITVRIYDGLPNAGGAEIGYAIRFIENSTEEWQSFMFSAPVELLVSTTYSFVVELFTKASEMDVLVARNTAGGYANGAKYTNTGGIWSAASGDLGFKLYTSTGGIGYNFTGADPSTMIRTMLDGFIASGGAIGYTTDTIPSTGTISSYNFKFDRIIDGIKKAHELAPADWYWYIDRGSNLLYFKYKASVPDHTFIVGKHLAEFEIEYTLEDLVNKRYFSGGDTGGGVNLFVLSTAQSSVSAYGEWLENQSDNRVTSVETAGIINQQALDRRSEPSYRTSITIPASVYDIETIELGNAIGFYNAGNFINTLVLQVVGLKRTPDYVTLRLDSALPTVAHRIEDISRNLEAVYTIANPDTPT